jgi:hypothetical protein
MKKLSKKFFLNGISNTKTYLIDTYESIEAKLSNAKDEFHKIRPGVTNLWKWRKIIYNDRWWDHSFFMIILRFKLETMKDSWDDAHYVGAQKEKEELEVLIALIDKIEDIDLDYSNNTSYEDKMKCYDELYHRLFGITSQHCIDKELTDGEIYVTGIGIERFWD